MLKLAKKFSINTILLQHGVMLDNPSAVNYNKIVAGILPIEADKFFVWGDISYEYAIQLNYPDHKIEITGNPNLDRIFEQKKKCVKKSNTVLLLATGPRDQQSVGHNVNEWKKYENLIKQICTVITKHNLNLIIKRHPDIAESDFSQQIHNEFSNVKILKHSEIIDLLLISKIVISVGISSAIFEAQILEKPVISIIADHDVYGSPKNVSHSCLETTVDNFEMNFLKLVTNSQFYQKIIRNGNEIMEKNIRYIGNSSKIILDSLGKS
jgi:CDP-glycerol glycerophosphotransferase (TagB/SpsB family)